MDGCKIMRGYTLYVPTMQGEVMVVSIPYSATAIDMAFFRKNIHEFFNEFIDELIAQKVQEEQING